MGRVAISSQIMSEGVTQSPAQCHDNDECLDHFTESIDVPKQNVNHMPEAHKGAKDEGGKDEVGTQPSSGSTSQEGKTTYITKSKAIRRRISPIICVILDPENIYEKSPEPDRLEMVRIDICCVDQKTLSLRQESNQRHVRNLIIHVKYGKTFLDPKYKFETAAELFEHHMRNPFTINEREILLMRGVGLTNWEFEHKSVNVGRMLGKGQYGEVRRGTLKLKSGIIVPVAIKSCKMDSGDISKEFIKEVMKEARLMRELDHPNVVKLYGVGVLERPLYILLEYVAGGALKSYLRKNKEYITNEERGHMALGAAWGIEHLHRKNILHRDIAARNCLYDHSSAVLIYEIYSAQDPYTETGPGVVRKKIMDGEFNVFPEGTPNELIKFVKEKMWNRKPELRADMDKVVEFFERFVGLTESIEASELQKPEVALTEEKKLEIFLNMRKRVAYSPMKTQLSQD
ncbi:protein tyrosine kinase [Dictyocaulus viviparus]|uniref:Protein tyrosine kinase n=1 Tax=Dictyocaulus viviparus TaxID=29172 RepID=A0A0D8YB50_DICVI|nr:protein tyrosine kinase [Dictyocaulus viviparus]